MWLKAIHGNNYLIEPIQSVDISRFCDSSLVKDNDKVIVETPITIEIHDVGTYTIFATPQDLRSLVAGFSFSEGIITHNKDIMLIKECKTNPNLIRMRLTELPKQKQNQRTLIITSSCGTCGVRSIKDIIDPLPRVPNSLRIEPQKILSLVDRLSLQQVLFKQTGGTHAAALFDSNSNIIAICEDIGRHNALDKVIGHCLLNEQNIYGCGVIMSSRISFELVAKAARSGIELIAGISAPSSMAIDTAIEKNITVCGFIRNGKMNIYSCPERIIEKL